VVGRLMKSAAGNALVAPLIRALEHAGGTRANLVRVLTYHDLDGPRGFAGQMRYLAQHYRVVTNAQVLEAVRGDVQLPPRAALITFDDAYVSFAEHAWPVLRDLALPVTVFVPTGYPDSGRAFWWDRLEHALNETPRHDALDTPRGQFALGTPQERARALHGLKREIKAMPHARAMQRVDELCSTLGAGSCEPRVLGWDALRQLAAEGVTLGAHTRNHPRLDRIPVAEAETEIRASLDDLEREIGCAPPLLAYPDGGYDDGVARAARRSGVELAFTTCRGTNDLALADPLQLRRIHAVPGDPLPVFRARLAHSSILLNRLRPLGPGRS